ncbi:hypothetical protein NP493_1807g00024 [Ridgeia piscesae]|uniref:Mucin-like protein n=1 Tax=Ridgeia piscesae TaxID=27915 RepID=A0AAD9N692_RIDPI|nr:hypothetical protein NP493_1807g00024 [Ridgeia piscesae]
MEGYTGHNCDNDINECESNPCKYGATCKDNVNSYSCKCMPGYTGYNCDSEINECDPHPCMNGATCLDQVNGYSCTCASGYTGDRCETDINECVPLPCMNGATCLDKVNRYSCTCASGYTGDRCETDIDECASSPCENGGSCENNIGYFNCTCVFDLYEGTVCHDAIRHRYYQYGSEHDDRLLGYDAAYYCDWSRKSCASDFLRVPTIQIFNGLYKRMKIYSNGYITFGLNFESRYPDRMDKNMLGYAKRKTAQKQGFAMLAPLWTDNDARYGQVYYHIYDKTQPGPTSKDKARVKHAVDHARDDVIENGGVSVTAVTWVMVITWSHMLPRMYYSPWYDSPNTFQLVIAYDPSRYQTFAMYHYMDMGWDNEFTRRRSMIGYFSYKYSQEESRELAPSMKRTAFRMQYRRGNTGTNGRYMFTVASGRHEVNYDQKCLNWFAGEMNWLWDLRFFLSWTLPCPCDRRLADMDSRWRFDWRLYYRTNYEKMCFYERIPWWFASQECCYNDWGSLITSTDGRGSHVSLVHRRWKTVHEMFDVRPKRWCCQFSDNCEYYTYLRPIDYCWGYIPPFLGWFYGDPHIRTLDGFQYTFNGLGEYTLVETTHGNFTLQGRTAKARDANGTETDATVFSAFAARDVDSDTVHIGMNATRDGFSLTIGVSARQLDITVGAPDKFKNHTKGLMGVFNGNATDDLLPPGENAVPLSNSSSEKTIFDEFGELWRILAVDSLFYYASGESYSTFAHKEFKPLFLEDVLKNMTKAERDKAEKTCGENKECLFDFAVTGNEDAAAATLATNSKNEEAAATLANASPNITVDKTFNVTVGQESTLTVTTFDADGDTVTVTENKNGPNDATFTDGEYKWKPTNMDPVNISYVLFTASDGKGGVAAAEVSVNLCDCSGHGECLFDLLADGYELKQTFRIVQCNCSTGWEGDHCESDLDGCQDNPCTEGTNCTDVTPEEEKSSGKSFKCSECPAGTEENEGTCLPINECDPDNKRHDCEQICVDTKDSFTCTCNDEYRLMPDNNKNCTDIDECTEGTSHCEQTCTNTVGSFVCSCVDGYTLNAENNKTCSISYTLDDDNKSCVDVDECETDNGGCAHFCTNFDGGFNCSFQRRLPTDEGPERPVPVARGARIVFVTATVVILTLCATRQADVTNVLTVSRVENCHDDINECNNNPCDEHANCTNTFGTFKCVCQAGYTQYNATVCKDLDECESVPCQNGGDCVNGNNAYSCSCEPGYNGTNCEIDIDECCISPCLNGGTCKDLINKFRCSCVRGFTGKTCETDIEECSSAPCQNEGNCSTPEINMFSCQCMPGYTGEMCETDVNDCANVTCMNGGTCQDLVDDYRCLCAAGYTGFNCCVNIDECISHPCMNNGTCDDLVNGFHCNCTASYNGSMCNIGQLCTARPCQNGGTCLETGNSRTCDCVAGYTGEDCETDIDECEGNPCQNGATCTDDINGYNCSCKAGYSGVKCGTDINECDANPCMYGATCVDGINGYNCTCAAGYTGDRCEIDIDDCESMPCMNGGTCQDLVNDYRCLCEAGYTGSNCSVVPTTPPTTTEKASKMTQSSESVDGTTNASGESTKETPTTTTPVVTTTTPLIPYTDLARVNIKVKLTSFDYTSDLADKTSDVYKSLKTTVVDTLMEVLASELGQGNFDIVDVTFSKGSVVVDYELAVKKETATQVMTTIVSTVKKVAKGGSFGNFTIDPNSVSATNSRWLPAVLGSVISLVLIILVVILIIFIARKVKANRVHDPTDADAPTVYSPTGSKQQMFWQQRSQAMPEGLNVSERYERQRMNVVSKAMKHAEHIDWSVMRNFAQRNVSRPGDMLHRDSRAPRQQRRGDEWIMFRRGKLMYSCGDVACNRISKRLMSDDPDQQVGS